MEDNNKAIGNQIKLHNKNNTQKYVRRIKTRKRIIKQAIMTGKQENVIVELLQQILAELKLTNHKKLKPVTRVKQFR